VSRCFDAISKAENFVINDRCPDNVDPEKLRAGAEKDLLINTNILGNVNEDYRSWMDAREEVYAPMPEDYVTTPKPYKSLFDRSND
jgi:hypothetical protein